MKKLIHRSVIVLLFFPIFIQSQEILSLGLNNESDYNVSNGEVFVWQFNDLDFVDNTYYIKFTINQIYNNNSIIGQVERYYPFLNISTNDTTDDKAIINPKEEIYILPAFDFFGLEFNYTIFVNETQLIYFKQNDFSTAEIEVGEKTIECFTFSTQGKEIWIDQNKGIVVQVEYVNVYSFKLVSLEDVDLYKFAEEMHLENSINYIYSFVISVGIAGAIISTHLMVRRYKKRRFIRKNVKVF